MPVQNPFSAVATDLPTGWLAHTYERRQGFSAVAPTSGRLHLSAIWLPAGTTVSSIKFISSTTPLATPSHGWAALYGPSLNLLGQSANDTAIAWLANVVKSFTLGAPVQTTVTGWHYLGVNLVATTMPTLVCVRPEASGSALSVLGPSTGGFSTSSLTDTAPATAGAIVASFLLYGGVA